MHIGVAGLGAMGAAIAARLLEVGHQVTVWNRSAEKTKPLVAAGAKVAASPADLASAVEAAITILTDGAARKPSCYPLPLDRSGANRLRQIRRRAATWTYSFFVFGGDW